MQTQVYGMFPDNDANYKRELKDHDIARGFCKNILLIDGADFLSG